MHNEKIEIANGGGRLLLGPSPSKPTLWILIRRSETIEVLLAFTSVWREPSKLGSRYTLSLLVKNNDNSITERRVPRAFFFVKLWTLLVKHYAKEASVFSLLRKITTYFAWIRIMLSRASWTWWLVPSISLASFFNVSYRFRAEFWVARSTMISSRNGGAVSSCKRKLIDQVRLWLKRPSF